MVFLTVTKKMLSQGNPSLYVAPKKFPFAHLKKSMHPPKTFDMGYHVTVLGKYSKGIPKREPSALDYRRSVSTLKWMNDTRKFNPSYYQSH